MHKDVRKQTYIAWNQNALCKYGDDAVKRAQCSSHTDRKHFSKYILTMTKLTLESLLMVWVATQQ